MIKVKMLNFLKRKVKKEVENNMDVSDAPDEEYQLPKLTKGNFSMTEKLQRRKEDEMLMKKYCIHPKKEGEFV